MQQRRVMFVGVASKRIQEDYLRILRYFRWESLYFIYIYIVKFKISRLNQGDAAIAHYFHSFYGRICQQSDNHDEATLATITENIGGLQQISGERIWGELQKILRGNFATELLETMLNCQMAKYIGEMVMWL